MARSFALIFFVCFALLATMVAAEADLEKRAPRQLQNISFSKKDYPNGKAFCTNWRKGAIDIAGKQCKHHISACTPTSRTTVRAWAGMVPFKNRKGCQPKSGPAKGPIGDITRQTVNWTKGKVVGKSKRSIEA